MVRRRRPAGRRRTHGAGRTRRLPYRSGGLFRLTELAAGDRIEVESAGGSSFRYAVTRAEDVPKNTFPTEAIFGSIQEMN